MNKGKEIIIGGISAKERHIFIRQLKGAIHAGYGMVDSLELAAVQSKGRLRQVLGDVAKRVKNGSYLHEALGEHSKYFSFLSINLIKTGELSGSLEESLERLDRILDKERSFKQKVRSAMTYPIFVFIAIIGLGISVAIFILPNLIPLFESLDADLPFTTRALLGVAHGLENFGAWIFWGFVLFIALVVFMVKLRVSKPFVHWVMLRFPLIGSLYRQILMARFARTIQSLLSSGLPIDQGLEITRSIMVNHYYQRAIGEMLPRIKKGESLSEALEQEKGLFDELFIRMLGLGEKTGSLEASFENVADYFESEVDYRMKNLSTSLEPILLIFVGLLVGFVALAILGPIYSITGTLR